MLYVITYVFTVNLSVCEGVSVYSNSRSSRIDLILFGFKSGQQYALLSNSIWQRGRLFQYCGGKLCNPSGQVV